MLIPQGMQSNMILPLATVAMVAQTVLAIPQSASLPAQAITTCVSNTIDTLVATGRYGSTVMDCGRVFEIVAVE